MNLHPVSLNKEKFEEVKSDLIPLILDFSRKDESQEKIEKKITELAGRKFSIKDTLKKAALVTNRSSEIYIKLEGQEAHHVVFRMVD